VRRVSIADPQFTFDEQDPPGFRAGMFRFGTVMGAKALGASVYLLPPGEAVCPYHYEHGEEEWLLVLEGRPSVRHPSGLHQLEPWDAVWFLPGPDDAHQVRNDTDVPARVLMSSQVVVPTATTYPDSGKVGIWTGTPADDGLFRQTSAVEYYDGEG
jgi:uncharacterized cupin superfamily protein